MTDVDLDRLATLLGEMRRALGTALHAADNLGDYLESLSVRVPTCQVHPEKKPMRVRRAGTREVVWACRECGKVLEG